MDHRFGAELNEDTSHNTTRERPFPDVNHPLYVHPAMDIQQDLSGGMFCNGLGWIIGKDTPYDLISIDVRVPPVCQLYNMATEDAWLEGWGRIAISPYKVWRAEGEFQKGL